MKKKIVVIGHNFNSMLAIARALGPENYEIGIVRTGLGGGFIKTLGSAPEKKSKYVGRYYVSDISRPEELIKLVIDKFSDKDSKPVLFPVDDIAAEILDNNYDLLRRDFVLPNVNDSQDGIVRLMDKSLQKSLAEESGVPITKGCSVKIINGEYSLPQGISYPCFVKPEKTFKSRKKFMGKCLNEQEVRRILDNAAKSVKDCSMLVENYVQIDKEYCIVGLCNGSQVCMPDVIDEILMGHESYSGVTCFGKIINPDKFNSFIEPLRDFLSRLGFHGLFTIDVLESGGKLYFCELNMRIGASGPAVIMSGVNLALMLCKILSGDKDIDYSLKCREKTFVNELPLMTDFGLKYITWAEYKEYIKKADIRFLYSPEDKAPMREYMIYMFKQWIKRFVK